MVLKISKKIHHAYDETFFLRSHQIFKILGFQNIPNLGCKFF